MPEKAWVSLRPPFEGEEPRVVHDIGGLRIDSLAREVQHRALSRSTSRRWPPMRCYPAWTPLTAREYS
eukprot:4845906-Heterocapsa_arctica.AAC.1